MTIGPIRPPMRGSFDPLVLALVGGIWRERTARVAAEAPAAKTFAIGFVFGCVVMFGVIAWITAGAVRMGQ